MIPSLSYTGSTLFKFVLTSSISSETVNIFSSTELEHELLQEFSLMSLLSFPILSLNFVSVVHLAMLSAVFDVLVASSSQTSCSAQHWL